MIKFLSIKFSINFKYTYDFIFGVLKFPEVENDEVAPGFLGIICEVAVAEVIGFEVVEELGVAFGVGEEVVEILQILGKREGGEDLAELEAVDVGGVHLQLELGE